MSSGKCVSFLVSTAGAQQAASASHALLAFAPSRRTQVWLYLPQVAGSQQVAKMGWILWGISLPLMAGVGRKVTLHHTLSVRTKSLAGLPLVKG